ncbi:UDP-3-O-(3-hydroxymyristoyl)glucosamine N-acyltransferase [Zoogloea sp.]|jgi:UDP-3-O-[3-hydroxymyristoyl] glucosamine N-acyltransferase|uniref:UDP-3-O-(3-hydroxymyristoyl)glucosamine N-acyltransferase n=1 Tax=Zoogloea sp. TaxID=49181 RepID=UPI0035AFE360
MDLTLGELVGRLGGELLGDPSVVVRQIASLDRAGEGELAFLVSPKYRAALEASRASAFILPAKAADFTDRPRILTPDPYLYFARAAQLFNPPKAVPAGVHPSAVVGSELPASVAVGPNAVIGADCRIGEGCVIGAGCLIGDGVTIGAGSLLHAGVKVYDGCTIGARAILHSGAVIGADGLGFARDADKHWVKIPQIGGVVIGDDVEIGANTTVDRGALEDTVIGNGVKLDNLIHVAHNCRVGEDTIMAAMAGLAGSTTVGKRVQVGGKAGFSGHLEVGDDIVISADTNVTKSIDRPGVYTAMIPLQPHADWVKNFSHLRRLDAMAERVRELEKKLAEQDKTS